LIVVVVVEIVDGLFCLVNDFLFLFGGNFFSALDLEVSFFAPLSWEIRTGKVVGYTELLQVPPSWRIGMALAKLQCIHSIINRV
jgi:hypothetical protein